MSLKSSIITYLKTQTGLTDLVGSRIYIDYAEEDAALPYVVISGVGNQHEHHLTSASGMVQGRFQFDNYGQTTVSAEDVAEQVRLSLDGKRGSVGDVFISTCRLDTDLDDVTPPVEGESRGIYSVKQDFLISWSVSVPASTFA